MKTKAEIVQRLLEEKKIDAEEAVVLLMGEEKQIQYIPYPYNPPYPVNPYPFWPQSPIYSMPPTLSADTGNYSSVIPVIFN